jgi:hypothetical protein
VNLEAARQLRRLLGNSECLARTRAFAASLRIAPHKPGDLLLLGNPEDEPWHFAAHLDDAARHSGQGQLAPTLVRHRVPVGAQPHLAVDLARLTSANAGETLLVVSPRALQPDLLNRIDDARCRGVAIFTLNAGDDDLNSLADEALVVTDAAPPTPWAGSMFDATEHLVTLAAAENSTDHLERRLDRITRLLRPASR